MSFDPDSLYRKLRALSITMQDGRPITDHLYSVKINRDATRDAQEWCEERFGDDWIWSSPTQTDWSLIYFKSPEDTLAFKLTFASYVTT